jgi:hypothetical protein
MADIAPLVDPSVDADSFDLSDPEFWTGPRDRTS